MNILVYDGPGVSPHCLHQTLRTLRTVLGTRYSVQKVGAAALGHEPWEPTAALLVVPGGRDKPYQEALHPAANARIRAYVAAGGRYLGLCAGGYYAGASVEFELGTPLEVHEPRELGFFPGVVRGGVYPGFVYDSEAGARAVPLQLEPGPREALADTVGPSPSSIHIYYNGGGAFVDADQLAGVHVLARYPEGEPAIIMTRVGQGKALLSGVHPEFDGLLLNEQDPVYADTALVAKLRACNRARLALFGHLMREMDLTVEAEHSALPPLTPIWLTGYTTAAVDAIKQRLQSARHASDRTIEGEHDRFAIYDAQEAIPSSPASMEEDSDEKPLLSLVLPSSSYSSSADAMPSGPFSLAAYYKHWQAARSLVEQLRAGAFGAVVMYSETVSSTQTLLEKNDALTRHLPDGTLCVATRQVSGRGRGGNAWVSPTGSLSFSMILRQPINTGLPSPVLVQYLVALAVVDAVRSKPGYEDMPLRLKWPNDIYASIADPAHSDAAPRPVKLGGILVNSSFQAGQFTLVIGCGVNVDNRAPTTSINWLVAMHNEAHGTQLAPFTVEEMLALIVTRLDSFYRQFLQSGFHSLLDLYYQYWLHSGQVVTLADQGAVRARILGITPDYGLLETVAVDVNGAELSPRQLYTLQPDGNSFDMMHNMISNKRS
ncbi:biotin-protein ligase [Syncephalis pseudoplumigaleata]|uniref:Biotin-protein ligase n=1 Tax=Syncephalis pseudoplumigaleata TaxID=1712513 RepID=A0A4P9Z779_9FUNG|nr:biotin-protein ligase [Syncephalis pseudoplumigaleata]|eukprot:RKP27550.1 biotin-protein ligase [Syncephalis pseudoplumigaleata]